ncbi:MAG TPA: efflux transporter outer membrane subunit [Verrucomicrobiae bacterium]|nr:efflux transporter outer membrane subunit [Verrucomicrobiae bacterium]
MIMRISTLLLLSAALTACAAGPDYREPAVAPAALAGAAPPEFSTAQVEARWWTQFGDPLLDELVRRALDANRDLRVAVARVQEARALAGAAQTEHWPVATAVAGWSRGEGLPPADGASWTLGAEARWELDLFGRVRRGVEAARAQAGAAEADLRAAQVSIVAEVARNYFELRGAERRLEVARLNRDKQRETLRLTEARREAGASSELEAASARARVADVEARVPLFEAAAQRLQHRLAVLLGERPGALGATLAAAPRIYLARELPLGDTRQWLRRRPDVQAAERRLAAATARQGVAIADLYPRLSLAGFVGFFTAGHAGLLVDSAAQAWRATPSLSWPGADWRGARARIGAAEAQVDAALAAHEQSVLLAIEEAENALVNYGRGRERLARLAEQAAASARAAELARVRYREGAADFLVLLDAERTLLQAEDGVAEAETAVNGAAVGIYRALGGGWDAQVTSRAD